MASARLCELKKKGADVPHTLLWAIIVMGSRINAGMNLAMYNPQQYYRRHVTFSYECFLSKMPDLSVRKTFQQDLVRRMPFSIRGMSRAIVPGSTIVAPVMVRSL